MQGAKARSIKQRDRQKGRYLGGKPPIGYTVGTDGALKEDGTRWRLIRAVLRLRAKGLSLRAIASEMARRGKKISHSSVREILHSAKLISREDEFPED